MERLRWLIPYGFVCNCEACKELQRFPTIKDLKVYDEQLFNTVFSLLPENTFKIIRNEVIKAAAALKAAPVILQRSIWVCACASLFCHVVITKNHRLSVDAFKLSIKI
jgi:hypothetical protein